MHTKSCILNFVITISCVYPQAVLITKIQKQKLIKEKQHFIETIFLLTTKTSYPQVVFKNVRTDSEYCFLYCKKGKR